MAHRLQTNPFHKKGYYIGNFCTFYGMHIRGEGAVYYDQRHPGARRYQSGNRFSQTSPSAFQSPS
jgi:hypothetical protein